MYTIHSARWPWGGTPKASSDGRGRVECSLTTPFLASGRAPLADALTFRVGEQSGLRRSTFPFGRFGEFWMTTGQLESFASIEVFHHDTLSTIGNRIVLEGYLNGLLVDSDILQLTQSGVSHDTLSISGTTFDELRFGGLGSMQDGIFLGFVDNVVITPEPLTLSFLLAGALMTCRSRRR